jgi:hypothetical protein
MENQCQIGLEKLKPTGNEQLPTRKSQDISNIMETEKIATKKSIYLKVAEFLLKYNIAAVCNFLIKAKFSLFFISSGQKKH